MGRDASTSAEQLAILHELEKKVLWLAGAFCWRPRRALDRGSLLAPARHKYLVIPAELLNLER